ncbi:MAG: hypothetical protein L0H29_07860 [Sinobacteraceae bacterium]|nr:hypothetical protein [Nevskiaceae bacterium]
MSTVGLIIGVCLLALILLDRIPGVRYLISPLISGASSAITVVVGSFAGWAAWAVKTFWQDHATLAKNLVSRREDIDPAERYR